MKRFLVLAAALVVSGTAHAGGPDVWHGLRWGMTPAQVDRALPLNSAGQIRIDQCDAQVKFTYINGQLDDIGIYYQENYAANGHERDAYAAACHDVLEGGLLRQYGKPISDDHGITGTAIHQNVFWKSNGTSIGFIEIDGESDPGIYLHNISVHFGKIISAAAR